MDDIEKLLGRLNPKGAETELRARILTAVDGELQSKRSSLWSRCVKPTPCRNGSGHRFVCTKCGIEAPLVERGLRWTTSKTVAATAMALVAAVLLLMFWNNGRGRPAGQSYKSPIGDRDVAEKSLTLPIKTIPGPLNPGKSTSPSFLNPEDQERRIMSHARDLWQPLASLDESDMPEIPRAGDTGLREVFRNRNPSRANQNGSSRITMEMVDVGVLDSALLERMLRETRPVFGGSE